MSSWQHFTLFWRTSWIDFFPQKNKWKLDFLVLVYCGFLQVGRINTPFKISLNLRLTTWCIHLGRGSWALLFTNEAFWEDGMAGTQASQKWLEWEEGQVTLALIVVRGAERLQWAFEPLASARGGSIWSFLEVCLDVGEEGTEKSGDWKLSGVKCQEWCQILITCLCSYVCLFASVVSDFFQPYGLQPARLLCPWVFQARILVWVAISTSRGSSKPSDQTRVSCVSCMAGGFFTTLYHSLATWEALLHPYYSLITLLK